LAVGALAVEDSGAVAEVSVGLGAVAASVAAAQVGDGDPNRES
jgi:hypothetical protein